MSDFIMDAATTLLVLPLLLTLLVLLHTYRREEECNAREHRGANLRMPLPAPPSLLLLLLPSSCLPTISSSAAAAPTTMTMTMTAAAVAVAIRMASMRMLKLELSRRIPHPHTSDPKNMDQKFSMQPADEDYLPNDRKGREEIHPASDGNTSLLCKSSGLNHPHCPQRNRLSTSCTNQSDNGQGQATVRSRSK